MNTRSFQSDLLLFSLAVAFGAVTFSHSAKAQSGATGLSIYDQNKDGVVSKEEFLVKGGSEKSFATFDLNGDGQLDKSEFGKASGEPTSPMPSR